MKNLSSFEAFNLNKVQMNAIAGGGAITCMIVDDQGTYFRSIVQTGLTVKEATQAVLDQNPDASRVSCKETVSY